MKQRPRDARDAEIDRLRAKVGEITMDNELLYEKIAKMEAGTPFCAPEVEAMSAVISIFALKNYGVSRVCRVWGLSRASVYRDLQPAAAELLVRRRPGPQGPYARCRAC